MSTLALTLILAIAIVLAAIALLAISWLITGKSSLQPGACGRDPTKKRDNSACGTTCHLCETPEDKLKAPCQSTLDSTEEKDD